MTFIKRFLSGVLRAICAFLLATLAPVVSLIEKHSKPVRTLYLSRQQRRYQARKKANDYTRGLTHLPRKWRRRYARGLAKQLFRMAPTSIPLT